MADRSVRVRLEADVAGFVAAIGGKAVAAVEALNAAAKGANTSVAKIGADGNLDKLGTKADAVGAKVAKVGVSAQASGSKIGAAASAAGRDLDKLATSTDMADKATASMSKTTEAAGKVTDAHANALGRLRVAQLKLAEVQKQSNPTGSAAASAEESVASAERAVKKFEQAGNDSGKSFGSGLKKWFAGDGSNIFAEMGKNGGNGILGALTGALKTPVIGPVLLAVMLGAVATVMPAVGAVAGGALVTGFGAGIAGLGLVFAAQSDRVGAVWSKTMSRLGEDMKLLSSPFESTLINIAGFFGRTVDAFNPALAAAFSKMSGPITTFVDEFSRALEQLVPAVGPIADAFNAVLATLGPAFQAAIGQISTGLTDLANSVSQNPQAFADFVTSLGSITKAALDLITLLNDVNTNFSTLTGGLSLVTIAMGSLTTGVAVLAAPFVGLNKVLELTNAAIGRTGKDSANAGQSMLDAANKTAALAQAHGGLAAAAQHAAAPVLTAAEAIAKQKKDAADAKAATEGYIASLFQLQNLALGLSGAQINFQAALDNATASIKTNGRTLDLNTAKGRANKTALDGIASSANAQTEAMLRSGKGYDASGLAAERSRANFVKVGMQMGLSKAQAEAMAAAMIAVPNVSRTARLQVEKKDLDAKLAAARKELADPNLTATKRAKLEATIAQLLAAKRTAQAEIDSLHGKQVALTINTYKNLIETHTVKPVGVLVPGQANGGYYPGGVPSYANGKMPDQAIIQQAVPGGIFQWAEPETQGEAFIPLAPSKRSRSTAILGQVASSFGMTLVKSFADGGFLPGGRLVDIGFLIKQLGIAFNPTSGVNYGSTLAAQTKANAAVVPARAASVRANQVEAAAKANVTDLSRDITLQQRYLTQLRAVQSTAKNPKVRDAQNAANDAKVKQEQKELIVLQDKLYAAKIRQKSATDASNKADATYKLRADAAKKATEAHAAAIQKLVEQQQAAVAMADQISQGLQQGSDIGTLFQQTLTGKGLLSDLQAKGADLAKFGTQLTRLRKSGLSEVLVQQIIAQGPSAGVELAQAILDGGRTLVNALNAAQKNIDKQADLIGAGSAVQKYGQAVAGARATGGPVDAGKAYLVGENGPEILRMGARPGWVDPNYVTGGYSGGSTTREIHVHQTLQFTGVSMAEADLIAQRANAKAELMAKGY